MADSNLMLLLNPWSMAPKKRGVGSWLCDHVLWNQLGQKRRNTWGLLRSHMGKPNKPADLFSSCLPHQRLRACKDEGRKAGQKGLSSQWCFLSEMGS